MTRRGEVELLQSEERTAQKREPLGDAGSPLESCRPVVVMLLFVCTKESIFTLERQQNFIVDPCVEKTTSFLLGLLRSASLAYANFDYAPARHSERSETESNCEAVRVVRRAESRRGFAQDDSLKGCLHRLYYRGMSMESFLHVPELWERQLAAADSAQKICSPNRIGEQRLKYLIKLKN